MHAYIKISLGQFKEPGGLWESIVTSLPPINKSQINTSSGQIDSLNSATHTTSNLIILNAPPPRPPISLTVICGNCTNQVIFILLLYLPVIYILISIL